MNTTTKWILAVIAAAVIGGGTVALLGNSGSTSQTQVPTTQKAEDCVIKGNISSSSEKIYHMPGQRFYDKTIIDVSAGEKWFCTEEEAVAVGWRKAKV